MSSFSEKVMQSLKVLTNRILKLETTKVLWSGLAKATDTITLNDDYTKYKILHVVLGTDSKDFRRSFGRKYN